mmetsp:Transcript_93626/g.279423  ORF Transcript_93626/g.279423 Transcript_93626/m.279423 type:complete len:306 (+) Transcript_93626:883-1800(+)
MSYPGFTQTLRRFRLKADGGELGASTICVLLGKACTGKTTFLRVVGGAIADDTGIKRMPCGKVAFMQQHLSFNFEGTVRALFSKRIAQALASPSFHAEVLVPLGVEAMLQKQVRRLQAGESQFVNMCLVLGLGQAAGLHIFDNALMSLSVAERLTVARVLRRFVSLSGCRVMIAERDLVFTTAVADTVVLFVSSKRTRSTRARASRPVSAAVALRAFRDAVGPAFAPCVPVFKRGFNQQQRDCRHAWLTLASLVQRGRAVPPEGAVQRLMTVPQLQPAFRQIICMAYPLLGDDWREPRLAWTCSC